MNDSQSYLMQSYIALIPLLPLAGFVLLGLFGRKYFKTVCGYHWYIIIIGINSFCHCILLMIIFLIMGK